MASRVVPAMGETMAREVPGQCIDECRFTDVGASDDCDLDFGGRAGLFVLDLGVFVEIIAARRGLLHQEVLFVGAIVFAAVGFGGDDLDDGLEQLGDAIAVFGGDRDRAP
jgi:hypothetical protein